MKLFQQKYFSGLSFSPPGDLPDPEIKPLSPVCCLGREVRATKEVQLVYHLGSFQRPKVVTRLFESSYLGLLVELIQFDHQLKKKINVIANKVKIFG